MSDTHSVAITGLSCRFPGDGDNLTNFWELICSGKSAWSTIPRERFNLEAFKSQSKNRHFITPTGAHFLKDDVSKFDANFFSIPKIEAEAIDPQHRIMIEVVYEALEKAGLPLDRLAGTQTGVFMGHFTSDYKESLFKDSESSPYCSATASCTTALANRISWLLDLRGPSFTLDTACSSSLVALHQACQSLRTGESDVAIVGGTSLLLNPEMFMFLSNQSFLSPDGKCKAFDESANGYGRGEGFGCVILKRVDDAISAGDPIRAVVRGTGMNQNGHTKGFTLPSADAQTVLIKETYRKAGLNFNDTGYVEAHGTGTQAGDVQETEAIAHTLAASHSQQNKLIVGSIKTNIGHLEAAAGIAGIIKSVLILENGLIPPSLNFKKGNPKIKFDEWNIQIPTALTPWPTNSLRRISTNSFGYGGANAHAVLDDAYHYLKQRGVSAHHYTKVSSIEQSTDGINGHENASFRTEPRHGQRLFVLSTQDKDGLERMKAPLITYIDAKATEKEREINNTEIFMSELAHTLSERRSRLQWKTYAIASTPSELITALRDKESSSLVAQSSRCPRLGFVFTGQGAQWPRMGVELMTYHTFKESVMTADSYLREECGCPWSAAAELQKGKSTSKLHVAAYSQTICTVLQVALVDLFRTWNITPTAVVGHSSGEIAAAYCMGALTKEHAWKIAYYRGLLSSDMKQIAPEMDGSMMAAGLSHKKAEEWISKVTEGEITVACINSPSSVTISGDSPGIDQLLSLLKEEGIFARKLQVDTAYHSQHMQIVAQDYYEVLADVVPLAASGDCTMHSSVTGTEIEASQLGAVNWVRNLTSPVQFASAIYDMLRPIRNGKRADEDAVDLLVEIGPHAALQGPSTQTLKAKGITNIPYQSMITRNQSAIDTAMDLAGALFARGVPVNTRQVNNDGSRYFVKPLVDLPMYPWKHSQKYWHESRVERQYLSREVPKLSLLGAPSPSLSEGERFWRGFIRLSEEPWIADHKIQGTILYPGAGYIAMAVEAAHQTADRTRKIASFKLRDIQLTSAAIIEEGVDLECIVQLRPHISSTRNSSSTWTEFSVTTSPDGKSIIKNCSGLIIIEYQDREGSDMQRERLFELQTRRIEYHEAKDLCKKILTPSEFYADLTSLGLEYGPAFANLSAIHNRDGQSVCTVKVPDVGARALETTGRPHIIHPGTLDAVFHLAFAALKGGKADLFSAMVPRSIDEITISNNVPFEAGSRLPGFANSSGHGFGEVKADIFMLDEHEDLPVIEITGFLCAEIAGASTSNSSESKAKSITSKLKWRPAIDLLTPEEQYLALDKPKGLDKIAEYLKLLHHSNPGLSILELASASQESSPRVLISDLTEVGTLLETGSITVTCRHEMMKSTLEKGSSLDKNIAVEVLDVSQEIRIELLENQGHDVILASNFSDNVLDLNIALENVHKLLKIGGKICIVEADEVLDRLQQVFDVHFVKRMIFRDLDSLQGQRISILIGEKGQTQATNAAIETIGDEREVTLIQTANPSDYTQSVASALSVVLEKSGYVTSTFVWGSDTSSLHGKRCISLLELENSILRDLTEFDFTSIQKLILESSSTFWVVGFDDPSAAMIDGLARVVRNETPSLSFRTFHAEVQSISSIECLVDWIGRSFVSKTADDEFQLKDNLLHVSRIEEDNILNEQINDLLPTANKRMSNVTLGQARYPLKLCVQTPGMLNSLCMELDDLPEIRLEDHEIEIQIKATALNFREIMVGMGQMSDSKLGFDAAGVVLRIGSGVTKFHIGDRVAMFGHGAHRTIHRSRADYCFKIPDQMSFEQAASIPTVHFTAWNALVRLAKVQRGQSILIHAAAGGVGQAAIQLAKHFDMEIFVTVSSEVKRKLIKEEYGVTDNHIFDSRDLGFSKGVKRMTNGRGVDVVLNSLSGEALRQTWYCVAPFGYFIEIGIRDILQNTELDMEPFNQSTTFSFFNLNDIEVSQPDMMASIVEGTYDMLCRGIIRPLSPLMVYPISEVESAFRLMQTGKHLGKIALTWGADDVVPMIHKDNSSLELDSNGVYMLAGGLGGLGRSLSLRLALLGARKLCFLSRSGDDSLQAKQLVHELTEQNIHVKICRCDIADEAAVAAAVNECRSELGEIRGVFQCAMVLRDTLFMNMDYQQWMESTRSKVQGSWNLHEKLPDVDFFITLSSFAAIFGNRGQSNYSAAGAYEDALAYHRRNLGQRAVTIDLGMMRDIGVLAETGMTDSLREWEKPYGIREAEFLALVERTISGDMAGTIAPQVITGLASGGSAITAGISTPFYLDDARFSILAKVGMRGQSTSRDGDSTQKLISQATSVEEATGYVVEALVKQVAKMLQTPVTEIDTSRYLHSYGIDSLVAIEVVNWALKEIKSAITVFDVMAGLPITTFSSKIVAKSGILPRELIAA